MEGSSRVGCQVSVLKMDDPARDPRVQLPPPSRYGRAVLRRCQVLVLKTSGPARGPGVQFPPLPPGESVLHRCQVLVSKTSGALWPLGVQLPHSPLYKKEEKWVMNAEVEKVLQES